MSKNFQRPPEEWSQHEKEVDKKLKVVRNDEGNFYVCSIPWKTNPPALFNNLQAVKTRQERTNSNDYLKAKGTDIDAIYAIFQSQIEKGYIEEITDPKEIYREDCNYIPYFPVVRLDRVTSKTRVVFTMQQQEIETKSP